MKSISLHSRIQKINNMKITFDDEKEYENFIARIEGRYEYTDEEKEKINKARERMRKAFEKFGGAEWKKKL